MTLRRVGKSEHYRPLFDPFPLYFLFYRVLKDPTSHFRDAGQFPVLVKITLESQFAGDVAILRVVRETRLRSQSPSFPIRS